MGMVSKLELLKLARRVQQSEPNDCTVWMERVVLKHDSEVCIVLYGRREYAL